MVICVDDVYDIDLGKLGSVVTRELNVNLTVYSADDEKLNARTYERGVEHETDSCGTGAMAIAMDCKKRKVDASSIRFNGGKYEILDVSANEKTSVSIQISHEDIKFWEI